MEVMSYEDFCQEPKIFFQKNNCNKGGHMGLLFVASLFIILFVIGIIGLAIGIVGIMIVHKKKEKWFKNS